MKVIRQKRNCRMAVFSDENERLLELLYLEGDFIIVFHANNIKLTKKDNKELFKMFNGILDDKYMFSIPESYQDENHFVWFSDLGTKYKSAKERGMVTSLVISRDPQKKELTLSYYNPRYDKENQENKMDLVTFSPMLGEYCLNETTLKRFQEEICTKYYNAFYAERNKPLNRIKQKFKVKQRSLLDVR